MPQLDTSTFASQLFWLGVCFFVLYLIMSYIAIPKIARVLEAREETIEAKINKASLYREEAENLLSDYEATLANAKERAQLNYKTRTGVTSKEMASRQKDVLDKLSDRLHLAEQDLFRSRKEAEKEIQTIGEEISSIILTKITGIESGQTKKGGKSRS